MHRTFRRSGLGAINVMTALVIIIVIAAVGFTAWKVYDSRSNKTASKLESPAVAAANQKAEEDCNAQYDNKDNDFCRFASHRNNTFSYTATTISKANGGTTVTKTSTDGNGNSLLTVKIGKNEIASYELLNGLTYRKDYTSGKWQKLAANDPGNVTVAPNNPASGMQIYTKDSKVPDAQRLTYTSVGKEACGGLSCFKYEIKDPSNSKSQQFIWFDDKEYTLRHVLATDSASKISTDTTYSYGEVKIELPSPLE